MKGKTGRCIVILALAVSLAAFVTPALAQPIELKGASQFDDTHSYNQTMLKFEEETKKCYAKPIKFTLHRNRELGLEKDYVDYMTQGLSGGYAVFAPSHAATFSKMTTIMDMRIGLIGMRERLDLLKGRLEITSQPGHGTRLVARVPWEAPS